MHPAYNQGWDAYCDRNNINPYEVGTIANKEWNNGYEEASHASDRELTGYYDPDMDEGFDDDHSPQYDDC